MLCYSPSSGFMISIRNPQSKSAILSQISFRDAMRYNLHNFMRIFISNCPTGNVLQNKRTNECILYKQTKSKGKLKKFKKPTNSRILNLLHCRLRCFMCRGIQLNMQELCSTHKYKIPCVGSSQIDVL